MLRISEETTEAPTIAEVVVETVGNAVGVASLSTGNFFVINYLNLHSNMLNFNGLSQKTPISENAFYRKYLLSNSTYL